jgi:hypothetical protein
MTQAHACADHTRIQMPESTEPCRRIVRKAREAQKRGHSVPDLPHMAPPPAGPRKETPRPPAHAHNSHCHSSFVLCGLHLVYVCMYACVCACVRLCAQLPGIFERNQKTLGLCASVSRDAIPCRHDLVCTHALVGSACARSRPYLVCILLV